MAETEGIIRMTISVPKALKQRMDAVKDEVNWSATAADAYESKLQELAASRLKGDTMKDVIERMKAADAKDKNESTKLGLEAGESWAKKEATPKQLRRLENKAAELDFTYDSDGAIPDLLTLAAIMTGEADKGFWWRDLDGYRDYLDGLGLDTQSMDDPDFLVGFVDGALKLWKTIAGQI